nr:membrane protein insertase YidC [Streptomyces sp. TS71-3]
MLVRLLVHPLSRAAARGQRAQARLSPRIAELRRRHHKNPEQLQKATMELYKEEKVSPLSGCLPSLLQVPAFFLLYRIFSSARMGGQPNALLGHTLFGSPLGGRFAGALAHGGLFGTRGLVYLGLFVIVAVVATFNYRKTKRTMAANEAATASASGTAKGGATKGGTARNSSAKSRTAENGSARNGMAKNGTAKAGRSGRDVAGRDGQGEPMAAMAAVTKAMPLMSFLTLITVAVVPLAAALYVVTSTTWSVVERAMLHKDAPAADSAAAPTADGASQGPKARARNRRAAATAKAAPAGAAKAVAAKAAKAGSAEPESAGAGSSRAATGATPAGRLARALKTTRFPRAAVLPGPAEAAKPAEGSGSSPA